MKRLELMNEYATIKGKMIHEAKDLEHPLRVDVDEADETVIELELEFFNQAKQEGISEDYIYKFKQRLCAFGGSALVFGADEYADLILEEGQLWYSSEVLFAEMPLGNCHQNAVQLYLEHQQIDQLPEAYLVVGYALSPGGFWFAHTWLVTKDETGEAITLETCADCQLYYGVILTPEESLDFVSKWSV